MDTSSRAHLNVLPCVLLVLSACGAAPQAPKPRVQPVLAPPPTPIDEDIRGPLYVRDVGLATPESVLYDPIADLYLVSNVAGSPLDADDRAFITRLRPDGKVQTLKWIDAERPDVTLDAPKGMVLSGNVLYVADIAHVRKFDRATGKPLGSIALPGASFVNDLSADEAGNLYVSDSGIAAPGYRPSGSDAVYKIDARGQVTVLGKDIGLGRPNGLLVDARGVWVATFASGEVYKLDAQGGRSDVSKPPKGSLDGLTRLGERLFVSSWEASAVYEREGDEWVERIPELPAPSDIGVDPKRKRLLIPLFYDDALVIYPL